MPIVDIQRRFRELGRIRTGEQVATGKTYQSGPRRGQPKMRPTKLPRFRLTSPWQHLIEHAAEAFGGDPRPWHNDGTGGDEYEVVVDVDSLPVIIPPGDFFEQWYELWTGGGCARRCDGKRQVLVDQPCRCPEDVFERQEKAAKNPPEACKPTTRVRLMLPDVADVGIWRLETHGFHAAAELGGAAGLVEAAVRLGTMIPADLRLQAREGARRPGEQRKKFYVPAITFRGTLGPVLDALGVLESGATMPALVGMEPRPAIDHGGTPALPAGTTFDPSPVERSSFPDQPPAPPAGDQVLDVDPGEGSIDAGDGFEPAGALDPGALEVEPAEDFEPPDRPVEDAGDGSGPALTGPQMVAMRLKDRGVEDRAERLAFVSAVVGRKVASSKELKPAEVREVLDVLRSDDRFAAMAGEALAYLDEPAPASTSTPADEPIETTAKPAEPAPAAPARETRRRAPSSSSSDDPSTWDGDRWRAVLKERGVKVVAVLREANRLARERDVKPPGTLDELKGSGIETEVLGYVEAEAAEGRS